MKTATTVTKVCRLMEQFQERQSLGVTDLARSTGLLPSDVHRILTSLRSNHYVDQDSETRKYRLGVTMMRLGLTAFERNRLREKAQPILVALSKRIGATTHLGLLDGRKLELILMHSINGPVGVTFEAHLGEVEGLHSTALGKTILASLDHQTLDSVLKTRGMSRSTSNTITDSAALEQQLKNVRRCGYAVDREEFVSDVCCLGSAVHDRTGAVVGAISASMPSSPFLSWNEARLGAIVKSAASNLSTILGYNEPRAQS